MVEYLGARAQDGQHMRPCTAEHQAYGGNWTEQSLLGQATDRLAQGRTQIEPAAHPLACVQTEVPKLR